MFHLKKSAICSNAACVGMLTAADIYRCYTEQKTDDFLFIREMRVQFIGRRFERLEHGDHLLLRFPGSLE